MRRVPLAKQSLLLFRRAWLQNLRDKATNVSRAMSNISSAAIFGSIFWRLGRSQTSVQNRMGLLQVWLNTGSGAWLQTECADEIQLARLIADDLVNLPRLLRRQSSIAACHAHEQQVGLSFVAMLWQARSNDPPLLHGNLP